MVTGAKNVINTMVDAEQHSFGVVRSSLCHDLDKAILACVIKLTLLEVLRE